MDIPNVNTKCIDSNTITALFLVVETSMDRTRHEQVGPLLSCSLMALILCNSGTHGDCPNFQRPPSVRQIDVHDTNCSLLADS